MQFKCFIHSSFTCVSFANQSNIIKRQCTGTVGNACVKAHLISPSKPCCMKLTWSSHGIIYRSDPAYIGCNQAIEQSILSQRREQEAHCLQQHVTNTQWKSDMSCLCIFLLFLLSFFPEMGISLWNKGGFTFTQWIRGRVIMRRVLKKVKSARCS